MLGFACAWLALAGRKAILWLLARFCGFERREHTPRSPAGTHTFHRGVQAGPLRVPLPRAEDPRPAEKRFVFRKEVNFIRSSLHRCTAAATATAYHYRFQHLSSSRRSRRRCWIALSIPLVFTRFGIGVCTFSRGAFFRASQLVVEDLCEVWSLFQQKLEIRLQQRFAQGGLSSGEVSCERWRGARSRASPASSRHDLVH